MFKWKIIKWLICLVVMCGLVSVGFAMGGKQEAEDRRQKAETKSESAKEKSKKIVEPVLVWEKTFDEPIVDVIFGEAEMTVAKARALGMKGLEQKKITEKVNVQYPKVVVTKKIAKFLDEKGILINEIPLRAVKSRVSKDTMIWEKVVVSPNGEYVLIKTPVHESVWDMRCVSRDGKILWEKKKVYGNVIISPQEDVIVIVGHIGGIQFCNKNGQVLKKHDLKWQVLIGEPAVFSEDGNYFIIGFSWYNKEKKLAENFLTLFDKAGNMLWKQRLKTTPIKIVVSHQSKKIYIIAREFFVKTNKPRDFIYLFDMNGSLIWEKEMGVYKNVNIALSEDDKFLAVSENPPSRKLKVSLYDNLNGEELWALRFEDDEIIKRRYINPQVSISPQGDFIALLLGHFWARGQGVGEKVILIDRGGKVVFQRDRFDGYIRDVQFSKNGKNLILLGNKHIYFYELNLK